MTTKTAVVSKEVANVFSKPTSQILGVEGMSGKQLATANIVLVQSMSAFLIDKGCKPGTLANTLTGKEVPDAVFVPAYMTEKLFVYKYDGQTQEFLFVADNDSDPRLEGKRFHYEDGQKPEVIPTIIVVALMGGTPVKIQFRKTSGYPAGKKLWSLVYEAGQRGAPLWGQQYRLKVEKQTNKKGIKYFGLDVELVGMAEDSEQDQAKALYDSFKHQADLVSPTDE